MSLPRYVAMWEALLRGLAIEAFFGEIVSRDRDGYVKINPEEAVKIVALSYFYRNERAFPVSWNPAVVLNDELGGFVDKFVNVIRRQVFNLHGSKVNMLCPTRHSLWLQGARAGATLGC